MAFGKKYQGGFYNHHRNPITVELYQDNYGGAVTDIWLSGCEMNYQVDGNIFTQSIDLSLQNTFTFAEFEELLENYEKQWMCKILNSESNPEVLFQGYLIVDVQEQALQDTPAEIRLTFSDQLKRLDGFSPTLVVDQLYSLLEIIKDCLDEIDSKDIYINSSLLHTNHNPSASPVGTFLEQSYVISDLFYQNNIEIDTAWEVIQKILKSFNLYLYVYKNDYYLERYNDLPDGGSALEKWYKVDKDTESNRDFIITEVIDRSQSLGTAYSILTKTGAMAFHSGLSDFELNLNNTTRITITPLKNVFEEIIWGAQTWQNVRLPHSSEIEFYKWYYPEFLITDDVFYFIPLKVGTLEFGINKYSMITYTSLTSKKDGGYMSWESTAYMNLMYLLVYKSRITFNQDPNVGTNLRIKWSVYVERSYAFTEDHSISGSFFLKKGSTGDYPNYYIIRDTDGSAKLSAVPYAWTLRVLNKDMTDKGSMQYHEFEMVMDLSNIADLCEEDETLIFGFRPTRYTTKPVGDSTTFQADPFIIGDIYVHVEDEGLDNQYLYDINSGFINKKSEELYIYDLASLNYSNGLMLSDGSKTDEGWYEQEELATESIVDKFIKSITGFNYKTRKEVKAQIIFDDDIEAKPLAFIESTAYVGVDFILSGAILWDMIRNIYQINAKEYSAEAGEINIIE